MRSELTFERNSACLSGFSSGRIIQFVQNGTLQVNLRNIASLGRKSSMLEAGVTSTLFPCEN
jgi:hypothetical protein